MVSHHYYSTNDYYSLSLQYNFSIYQKSLFKQVHSSVLFLRLYIPNSVRRKYGILDISVFQSVENDFLFCLWWQICDWLLHSVLWLRLRCDASFFPHDQLYVQKKCRLFYLLLLSHSLFFVLLVFQYSLSLHHSRDRSLASTLQLPCLNLLAGFSWSSISDLDHLYWD